MSDLIWPALHVDGKLTHARAEWIAGNGAGAYASSTVALMHTRRYHGLLVAALEPPLKRTVVVSHVDTRLQDGAHEIELASHQFPTVPPREGYRYLQWFHQDPLPRWTYGLARGTLEKTLALVRGANALVIRYVWSGAAPIPMSARPLLAMRDHHGLTHVHGAMIQRVLLRPREVCVQPLRSLPKVVFRHAGTFVGSPDWWHRFEYLDEQDRGLEFQEDLWSPGVFRLTLQPDVPQYIVVGLDSLPDREGDELFEESADALRACDPGPTRCWSVRSLSVAANLFRADLCPTPGIIAGYPWFEIWGRHTLIGLPGLYFTTGRVEQAKSVVESLLHRMLAGRLPNRLPDDGRPAEYHAADATLLLFGVARRLTELLPEGDPFPRNVLLPALRDVFEAHLAGTHDDIRVTPSGLLSAGNPGTSLTWMDARVAGHPVSSRWGLAVELQALWSKGCDDLSWLADRFGDTALATKAALARDAARQSFSRRFWCEQTNYPYDVMSASEEPHAAWSDASVRPNALVALSIDPSLFTHDQARSIIERVERDLLTEMGIRTLSPYEPGYRGTYTGGIEDRDRAYHQGTAWPFLFGALSRAIRHTFPDDADRKDRMRALLESALSKQVAVGQVPEVADGDPPHRPDGCVAYAASVAEMLRSLVDDLGL